MSESGSSEAFLGVNRSRRPLSIRLLNGLGAFGELLGLQSGIDTPELMELAQRKTGLIDFDGDYAIEALNVLIESINEEARLTPVGQLIQRRRILNALFARLKIREFQRKNQDLVDRPLNKVILIAGLQRTGTTLLQRLIASHPQFRGITAAEAFDPVAVVTGLTHNVNAANRQAWIYEKALSFLAPEFKTIHPVDRSEPEEDVLLLDLNFMSQSPEAMMRVPSYSNWLENQDHHPVYAHFQKTLKMLQISDPRTHWVLKSPHHLEYLDIVLKQFPDATIVQTHRDPRRTMPSFCSMVAHSFRIFSDHVDTDEIATHWLRKVKRMIQKSLDVRALNPACFFDVSYYDLIERPLDVLAGLWNHVGVEFGDAERIAAQRCLTGNPKNRFGRHEYRLRDFGFDTHKIDSEFRSYRADFDIPIES